MYHNTREQHGRENDEHSDEDVVSMVESNAIVIMTIVATTQTVMVSFDCVEFIKAEP